MKKAIAIALLLTATTASADVVQLRRYVTTLATERFALLELAADDQGGTQRDERHSER